MKSKKEQLRDFICKQIPSILELKFGCEVIYRSFGDIGSFEKKCLFLYKEKRSYEDFTRFWVLNPEDNSEHFSKTIGIAKKYGDDSSIEIIGHPITLENVLRVIYKKEKFRNDIEICPSGMFVGNYYDWEQEPVFWDLTKDFNNQSEEFYNWFYNLLIKNK